mmetsp:Transcript_14833/g.42095  ORF Transcript_14833/g.42095 Transcript_14833/m.42095 type:complete len:209 (-) Transcript_14833:96-722(-)
MCARVALEAERCLSFSFMGPEHGCCCGVVLPRVCGTRVGRLAFTKLRRARLSLLRFYGAGRARGLRKESSVRRLFAAEVRPRFTTSIIRCFGRRSGGSQADAAFIPSEACSTLRRAGAVRARAARPADRARARGIVGQEVQGPAHVSLGRGLALVAARRGRASVRGSLPGEAPAAAAHRQKTTVRDRGAPPAVRALVARSHGVRDAIT